MIPILLLIGIGVFIFLKGDIRILDSKRAIRPQAIYWILILITYSLLVVFLSNGDSTYICLTFYPSLTITLIVFLIKRKTIRHNEDAFAKPIDTKKNLIIFSVFLAIGAIIFYFLLKSLNL
jgi:cobalamin synthase